ncbi:MAG: DEAD/DEAH box helicase [Desulfobacterales bacterium]
MARRAEYPRRRRRPAPHQPPKSPKTPRVQHLKAGADAKLKRVFAGIGVPVHRPFRPDPYQIEAVAAIQRSDCLVTAPTGAGKTWIALQAITRLRQKNGSAWYASPLKALSNAKYAEFSALFGADQVGILTGDRKENPEAPVIVGTTEILRNHLYDAMHHGESLKTDLVVLDEAHFLGDPERGVVWEEIMIYLPPRIPLLLLSATIGNADRIADWLAGMRGRKCTVVAETRRPVPLYPLFFHPTGTLLPFVAATGTDGKPRLYRKVKEFVSTRHPPRIALPGRLPPFGEMLGVLKKYDLLPAIFFLKSRADCDRALDLCREYTPQNGERRETLSRRIHELVADSPHIAHHRQRRFLEHQAVGSHHSGQPPAWKLVLESLMSAGLLDAVFATSTVAAGVNFPARTVVFFNSDRFNGLDFAPLSPTEFHQMTGRAGRRGMDNIGFCVAVPGRYMDVRLAARLIQAPPSDVTSQIRINFSMVLNLLLSHAPPQVEDLLQRSFATYLLKHSAARGAARKKRRDDTDALWRDFLRHLAFLKEHAYVDSEGRLTEDGGWASQLRVDQPLLIAEALRQDALPDRDPALMAALTAAFVFERESDDRFEKSALPLPLLTAFLKLREALTPFARDLMAQGFPARPLYLRPAVAVYAWATEEPWDKTLAVAEMEEGIFASLILRTADNLRHIRNLKAIFPVAAATAGQAIDRIMRDPVALYY